jgi:hypothetical protein
MTGDIIWTILVDVCIIFFARPYLLPVVVSVDLFFIPLPFDSEFNKLIIYVVMSGDYLLFYFYLPTWQLHLELGIPFGVLF